MKTKTLDGDSFCVYSVNLFSLRNGSGKNFSGEIEIPIRKFIATKRTPHTVTIDGNRVFISTDDKRLFFSFDEAVDFSKKIISSRIERLDELSRSFHEIHRALSGLKEDELKKVLFI